MAKQSMNGVTLSDEQAKAVSDILDWFMLGDKSPQTFFLSGFAGTGKSMVITIIIQKIVAYLEKNSKLVTNSKNELENIQVACPTGKAVNVINDNFLDSGFHYKIAVDTIHGFAFYPKPVVKRQKVKRVDIGRYKNRKNIRIVKDVDKNDEYTIEIENVYFTQKEREKVEVVDLLIVDEASMITSKMYQDIIDYDIKILFVGDTAQLPPVEKNFERVNVLGEPNARLTTIFRQAEGNAIRELSEHIRNGKPLQEGVYGTKNEVKIISHETFWRNAELRRQIYLHADQVICGRNDTRRLLNQEIRYVKGFSGDLPMVGEKVICLKNQKEIRIGGLDLVNGLTGEVVDVDTTNLVPVKNNEHTFSMTFRPEGVEDIFHQKLTVSTLPFQEEKISGAYMHRSPHSFFDFGYAITCHKSQGSQWDNVLVLEEMLSSDIHLNWLYTAVTRAKKGLIVVKR